jgi:hypothetical protein
MIKRFFAPAVFSISLIFGWNAFAESTAESENTEASRLKGFNDKKQNDILFEQQRLQGIGEVKKKRAEWEKQLNEAKKDYLIEKKKQKSTIDESGPAYRQDREAKYQQWVEAQTEQKKYSQEKKLKEMQKQRVRLSPEVEFGLEPKPQRVDPETRALYGKRTWFSDSRLNFSGSGSGASGYTPPSSFDDFTPPPAPPNMPPPEFFEPDIPPPAPPAPMDLDEIPPPPIIEDDF